MMTFVVLDVLYSGHERNISHQIYANSILPSNSIVVFILFSTQKRRFPNNVTNMEASQSVQRESPRSLIHRRLL